VAGAIQWRGGAEGHVQLDRASTPATLKTPRELVEWLAAHPGELSEEATETLGSCAYQLALAQERHTTAGFVLAAVDRRLNEAGSFDYPCFARGVERLRDHLMPLRGEAGGTIVDAGHAFVRLLVARS
jgi:hypothetical protein